MMLIMENWRRFLLSEKTKTLSKAKQETLNADIDDEFGQFDASTARQTKLAKKRNFPWGGNGRVVYYKDGTGYMENINGARIKLSKAEVNYIEKGEESPSPQQAKAQQPAAQAKEPAPKAKESSVAAAFKRIAAKKGPKYAAALKKKVSKTGLLGALDDPALKGILNRDKKFNQQMAAHDKAAKVAAQAGKQPAVAQAGKQPAAATAKTPIEPTKLTGDRSVKQKMGDMPGDLARRKAGKPTIAQEPGAAKAPAEKKKEEATPAAATPFKKEPNLPAYKKKYKGKPVADFSEDKQVLAQKGRTTREKKRRQFRTAYRRAKKANIKYFHLGDNYQHSIYAVA